MLTNHNRLVLDMQIIMPRVNNLPTVSTCRERQWHSARRYVVIILFGAKVVRIENMPYFEPFTVSYYRNSLEVEAFYSALMRFI